MVNWRVVFSFTMGLALSAWGGDQAAPSFNPSAKAPETCGQALTPQQKLAQIEGADLNDLQFLTHMRDYFFLGGEWSALPRALAHRLVTYLSEAPIAYVSEDDNQNIVATLSPIIEAMEAVSETMTLLNQQIAQIGERRPKMSNLLRGQILAQVQSQMKYAGSIDRDAFDMDRSYGYQIFPKDDPMWSDPAFLARHMDYSGPFGTRFAAASWSSQNQDESRSYGDLWREFTGTGIRFFTVNGSQANNSVFDLARTIQKDLQSEKKVPVSQQEPGVLFFEGVYAGASHQIQEYYGHVLNESGRESLDKFFLKNVTQESLTDQADQAQLKKEAEVLEKIRNLAVAADPPIRVLFMEPIHNLHSNGMNGGEAVYFYRPQFLQQLRALCDELQIAIFADEVMTGGGRTGKFFGYQHYPGFEPDFVSFGKGLLVSGVARLPRSEYFGFFEGPVTTSLAPEQLLKARLVLKEISKKGFLEQVTEVGEYFKEQLKRANPNGQVRGIGLFLFSSKIPIGIRACSHNRLLPHLKITKSDIDQIFEKEKAK